MTDDGPRWNPYSANCPTRVVLDRGLRERAVGRAEKLVVCAFEELGGVALLRAEHHVARLRDALGVLRLVWDAREVRGPHLAQAVGREGEDGLEGEGVRGAEEGRENAEGRGVHRV